MSFKKNKYVIVKKAISKDLATFLYNYLLIKRQVARTLFDTRYISPFEKMFGTFGDGQVPNAFGIYSDVAMETLLLKIQPLVEKHTKMKLTPNYTYTRIYTKGDILARHKDRFSCEISTTLNLGGDIWPIYIDTTGSDNVINEQKNIMKPNAPKGTKVILKPGDMLVYKGNICEHWREPLDGDECAQVFLHYNNIKTKGAEKNLFDGRLHLGIPKDIKRND